MKRFMTNLKAQAEENPGWAIGLGLGTIATLTQFTKVASQASAARTYKKETKRRIEKDKLKKLDR
jgi:hypothetical protein